MGSLPPTGIYRIVEEGEKMQHMHIGTHNTLTATQAHNHTSTHSRPHRHTTTATQAHTDTNIDTQTGTYTVNQFKSPLPTGTHEELHGHNHQKCEIHIHMLYIY